MIRQMDVKNVILHGYLKEAFFVEQPPRFTNLTFPNHVCHLKCALYALKQAPWLGFNDFHFSYKPWFPL